MEYKDYLNKIINNQDLTEEESYNAFSQIMEGKWNDIEIAGFLTALATKKESISEIKGATKVMREKAVKINIEDKNNLLDTCGTGGDGSNTFNISTAVAIVAAASGIKVAKHGNRSASSKVGSADVLEALGIKIDLKPEYSQKLLEEIDIAFLFAPLYHPAMKYAIGVRKTLKIKTIFNILGPMTNPAGSKRQIMGVFSPNLIKNIIKVLAELGGEHIIVYSGKSGFDEIALHEETIIYEYKNGSLKNYIVKPTDFGINFASLDSIKGAENAHEAAKIILNILEGKDKGPKYDSVILNSGFALYVGGKVKNIKDGIELAKDIIDTHKALDKLNEWITKSNKFD